MSDDRRRGSYGPSDEGANRTSHPWGLAARRQSPFEGESHSGMSLLQDGDVIRETYEVERFLGEGAFGEVYRVKHRFLGRQAMKVFKKIGTLEETEQMLGEAILLSRIGHPNIVRVFDANTVETSKGSCGFFTMEYVAGGSLESFWVSHRDRFVPVEKTGEILVQVCQGLAVAHAENPPIVHRDVKPQNVLVGYDATGLRVRISDFGLAKRADPVTFMVTARGTLPFKAPETRANPRSDSCAGDVWALGTMAYLLLTDRLPFEDQPGVEAFLGKHFRRPPQPPSRFNIDVDPLLDQIVLRTLEPRPQDRPQNASELAEELTRWKAQTSRKPAKARGSPMPKTSKSVLGIPSPADESRAQQMADAALNLARQASSLQEAADVMEESFNKSPRLRSLYEERLKLWRNGVMM